MTVGRRDVRPNRPKRVKARGARTGMLALLALSAGAGCGQAMLRPEGGPGRTASSLGLAVEPTPARKLAWDDFGERLRMSAAAPGRLAEVSVAGGNLLGTAVPPSYLNLGTTSGVARGGPLLAQTATTWNGWKLPPGRGPESLAATAAI